MAVSYVDGLTGAYDTDVTAVPPPTLWKLPVPPNLVAGDLLIFSFSLKMGDVAAPVFSPIPAGAAALLPSTKTSASTTSVLGSAVFYKFVTAQEAASPPASFDFTLDSGLDGSYSTVRYRGVDTASPFAISAGIIASAATTSSTSTSKTSPAVTTTVADTMLVAGVTHRSGSATLTAGDPATYTMAANGFALGGRGHAVAHKLQATAGASTTAVWRQSSGGVGVAWQTALRPAAVVAPTAPTLANRVVGVPSTTAGRVTVKTANASSVRLKVGTDAAVTAGVVYGPAATPDAEGTARLTVTGLAAGTKYYYRVAMTDSGGTEVLDSQATVGTFKTAPAGQASFAFTFGSCTNATDSAAMTAIAARADDLFFHLGDLYYADGSGTGLANFRAKMDAKITAPNHAAVFATTPTVYTPSDHDGMTDDSTAGGDATAWTNWNTAYRERFAPPSVPGSTGIYHTFTWGRVRFIVLDTRSFQTVGTTILGATQKQWLKDTITASPEKTIVLVQDNIWVGAEDPASDTWTGSVAERTELASFFAASGKGIVMLGGDMHAVAADDGTNAPGGIAVFHASPLNNTASQKGGPYATGPYPASGTATVQQYGRVVVTDSGTSIALAFTGYSSDNTQRVALTETVVTVSTGTAVGSWSTVGAAIGKSVRRGTAAGSWATTGAATGKTVRRGTAMGSWSTTGVAVGATVRRGSASGTFAFTGAATGRATKRGTATGTVTYTGAAVGRTIKRGTAVGSTAWTGVAVGSAPAVGVADGTAAGTWAYTGTATGKRSSTGSATGTTLWTATAVGASPAVDQQAGTATGSVTWTGTAVGRKTSRGTAAGVATWTGTATGRIQRTGVAVSGYLYTGTAVGRTPGAGRDITLTVGPLRSRSVTGAMRARSTTGTLTARTLAGQLRS